MIATIICDRCRRSIEPTTSERLGYLEVKSPAVMIHMGAHGDGYAKTFAYIDLCPECTARFHEWMKGDQAHA